MARNDIEDMLDQLRRIKSVGDLNSVKIDQIVHSVFDGIPDEYKNNHNLERGVLTLLESVQGNTNLRYNYELNDSDLSEYMGCLDKNLMMMCLQWGSLSDPSWTNEEILVRNRFTKKLKIIRRKMGFLRYIYVSEIIGYIDHEKLEGLQARIQFMADNVGQFCLALWVAVGTDDILSKPDYLLCLIVLVELEMKNIFLGELKASKYAKSRTFKDKKLPKGFSHHLHSLLVYLRNKKIENFPNNVSSRNIDVTIEFLLVFLNDDGSNHVISGNWLNEVMEKVGAIAGDVLYVIQKLLPRSINKNDTSNINVCSIQILEKVEDLKAQVETYYKSLKFTPSQFPIVGGLSFLDSLLRKLHDMLKSESGLVFMMKHGIGMCILYKRTL
ncbi:hypothetical protein KY290_037940 [Solanum tuberosum]|uniref:Tospovirus resistance protein A n=1 Tax=Solanum tuberosum TaxID=4113 RepID=A0ABQ7U0Q6_SOLTU|nr:hypothetical protein KY290_037940 [Solanum tuberosum]